MIDLVSLFVPILRIRFVLNRRQPIYNETIAELPQYEGTQAYFVDISNDGIKVERNFRKDTIDFWTNVERQVFAWPAAGSKQSD